MRRTTFFMLSGLAGCIAGPLPLVAPDPSMRIVGGIADLRPYLGRLQRIGGADAGEFLLASCGCGEWRVLMADATTGEQWQFPVLFYAAEADPYADSVTVQGQEGDATLLATLSQVAGSAQGHTRRAADILIIDARRGESHTDDARACVRCHVGDNPIWPQPPGHPAFQLEPANCLSCHEVVIKD